MNLLIFVLGTAVGSFLNVLIDRIPLGESVIGGRSHCDSCKHRLAWYDLIPLLSWILLQGKCRYCKAKISWQYPIIEFTSGILFIFGYNFVEKTPAIAGVFSTDLFSLSVVDVLNILFVWFILSALLVIFVTDLKNYIIPDMVLFPTLLLVILYRLVSSSYFPLSTIYYPLSGSFSVFSSIGAALFFLMLVLITRGKGMGMGDVKYALLMGLLLGYPGIIVGLYAAFLTGAMVSVILILLGRKKFGQYVPFGPFLVLGTVITWFWGDLIWGIFWQGF